MIITRAPSLRIPEQLLEFGFYGIGVCLQHADGDLEMLVEPRPWRPKRPHTTDCWWFAETAYARFLKQSPTDPSGLSLTPSRPDLCN
ncbi:hypothetical protein [Streptomyces sp. NPDC005507]|uniref:hypothetical protein n=1 Tax=Streptomyces sp. NPDC005507 TaxID=3154885 RepID=UPI0033BD1A2A